MKKTKPTSNVKTLRAIRDRLNKKLEGLSSEEVLAYFKAKRGSVAKPNTRRRGKSAAIAPGKSGARVRAKSGKVKV
jgi:hypothetical protein